MQYIIVHGFATYYTHIMPDKNQTFIFNVY